MRIKMVGNDLNEKKPTFSKLLLPGCSTQHLMIPPGFLKHIRNDLSERATLQLKVSSDHLWFVEVKKTTHGVRLEDGWEQFLRDNSLDNYEFLVFTYYGRMQFIVDVFHNSGRERLDDFPKIRAASAFASTSKRPLGRPGKLPASTSMLPGPSNPCKYEPEVEIIPGKDYEIKEEKEEYEYNTDVHLEGAESKPFKFQSPHFIATIKQRHNLPIPTGFSKEHFRTHEHHEVTLINTEGEKWIVRANPSHGSHVLAAGWTKFASDNCFNINDTCIFEHVKGNKLLVRKLGKI